MRVERSSSTVTKEINPIRFRIMFGLAGIGFGSIVDRHVERRMTKTRVFDRRIFLHKVFYGYTGYVLGQVIDNTKL